MRWKLLVILALIVTAVVVPMCLFTVDRTEYVYLTQFGRHLDTDTYDGGDDGQAGLHFKWPWPVQSVQRFDRRLQYFDLPSAELLTRDPKRNTIDRTLTIDAYVCWRIADKKETGGKDPVDTFIRSVGTPSGAQGTLGQRISSELGAAIAQKELDDLINHEDPDKVNKTHIWLRKRLLDGVADAESEYGIKVIDIQLRRSNHPAAVREAIFERIRSERKKKAAEYESEGERRKKDIESAGALLVAQMRTKAEARSIELRGQANAEADRIRNEAQSKDPQFYTFLKKLEEYQRILGDNKSTLLLSTHRELFDVLFNPPSPGKMSPLSPTRAIDGHGKSDKPSTPMIRQGGP